MWSEDFRTKITEKSSLRIQLSPLLSRMRTIEIKMWNTNWRDRRITKMAWKRDKNSRLIKTDEQNLEKKYNGKCNIRQVMSILFLLCMKF